MYLLDTNVISEIRKVNHAKCLPLFKTWFDNTDLKLCYLSSITMCEIERGILQKAQKIKFRRILFANGLNIKSNLNLKGVFYH